MNNPNTTDIEFSGAHEKVLGQNFLWDTQFLELMEKVHLKLSDLKMIAEESHAWIEKQGWLVGQTGILFTVNTECRDLTNPLEYLPVKPHDEVNCPFSAMIRANLSLVEQEISKLTKRFRGPAGGDRLEVGARFGIGFAHEVTHAFGINRQNTCFSSWPLLELELLTDACALLACESQFGEPASLGTTYLIERLSKMQRPITTKAAIALAQDIIANAKAKTRRYQNQR